MNTTRKSTKHRAITIKAMRRPLTGDFLNSLSVGPKGSIRTTDISGVLQPENKNFNIDGCDWRGAAYIYFKFSPYHTAISDGDCFYFLYPNNEQTEVSMNRNATSIICFHHFYTRFLDEGRVPPFRTDIVSKFQYMLPLLKAHEFESELVTIQRGLGYRAFRTWADFIRHLDPPAPAATLLSPADRLLGLNKIITNAPELVAFLMSPIDETDRIISQLDFVGEDDEQLTSLVLEKLDWHEIYITTDQEPIAIDWLRRLDMILKRKSD